MAKHICKNPSCQKTFDYCRACIFKPIYYHEAGYCSEKCCTEHRADKQTLQVEEITVVETQPEQIIEVVELQNEIPCEEDTSSFGTEECVSNEDIETAQEE